MRCEPPYLQGAYVVPERVERWDHYPFDLPLVRGLDLRLDSAVTILVGENGCGKSTLLQALAVLARLPPGGGGRSELGYDHGQAGAGGSALAEVMRPRLRRHPRNAWYFRADMLNTYATSLVQRGGEHALGSDEDALYADRPLHSLSHGEAFLATIHNRAREGLLFFDEPESALSPQRQLTLLAVLARGVASGETQAVIATHSPILMTFPGATLLRCDDGALAPTTLEQTSHYEITKGMLDCPERYWKHLLE